MKHIKLFEGSQTEIQYLFLYPYGGYGSEYVIGKGSNLQQGLKDARDEHFHGRGGADPSRAELSDFLKEAIFIASFYPDGRIEPNDKSMAKLLSGL
jgi:hypothetical protein